MRHNDEDMQLAVKRGAYFMDEQYPNWATTIDFETFEMDSCQKCIVGQAIGSYGDAIGRASGSKPYSHEANLWAVEHGFDVGMECFDNLESEYEAYSALETLWTEQVKDRLGDAPQA